jgi:DNA-binding HxlR family transcriptional regulator
MNSPLSGWPCSVARAADVFGDSWTMLILRDCMYGLTRFDEFQRSLGIARNTLSARLSKLVSHGVLTKRFYQDNPPRYEYLLTDKGRELFPVLSAMITWGDKWLDEGAGGPVSLFHEKCEHDLNAQVVCGHCGDPVVGGEVQFCVGPTYPETVKPEVDIRDRLAPAHGGAGGRGHMRQGFSLTRD